MGNAAKLQMFSSQKLPAILYDNIVVCIVLVLHLLNAQLTNLELF